MNPTDLPELSKPKFSIKKTWENQNVQKPKFTENPKTLTTIKFSAREHSQVAIYTVFHAESESAVRNLRKLHENQNV